MKDNSCKAYLHTYKCPSKTCEECEYRYSPKAEIIKKLENLAIQTDYPIYKDNKIVDNYILLSDVANLINEYEFNY